MTLNKEQLQEKIQELITHRTNILSRMEQIKNEIKTLENEHWITIGQIKQLRELIEEPQEEQND